LVIEGFWKRAEATPTTPHTARRLDSNRRAGRQPELFGPISLHSTPSLHHSKKVSLNYLAAEQKWQKPEIMKITK
jgi:hypothetical protein